MDSENFERDGSNTEKKERVQVDISRRMLAEVERIKQSTGERKRSTIIEEWLRWAIESINAETGRLPDVHPVTGRSLSEIQEHPRITFRGTREP